jgi:hypothetical protein
MNNERKASPPNRSTFFGREGFANRSMERFLGPVIISIETSARDPGLNSFTVSIALFWDIGLVFDWEALVGCVSKKKDWSLSIVSIEKSAEDP